MGQIGMAVGRAFLYLRYPFGNPLCFVDSRTLFTGPPG